MEFRNIVVPYDGSSHAKSALAYAKGMLSDAPDAHLTVVHVVPSGVVGQDRIGTEGALDGVPAGLLVYGQTEGAVLRVLDEARAKVLDHVGDALDDLGARASVEAVAGASAADALARFAEEHKADLIVMGRRGLGALRGMLGSVSFGVLRSTDIPVLTVK